LLYCRLVYIYHCVSGSFIKEVQPVPVDLRRSEDVRPWPVSYKYWDLADMEQAMAAVEQTGTSIREAAKCSMFHHLATLHDRVSGKV